LTELRKPNFFVIGAPRCGTTALSKHLAKHPDVCFAHPLEPHYFARLDHSPTQEEALRDYVEPFFQHCTKAHKAIGDRSVSYFFTPFSVRYILDFNPDAKFIANVRNPIDFAYSYHARTVFNMDEDVTDFETAWNLQEQRARGERLPRLCRDPLLVQYREVARLGTHLERLYRVAGRERCCTILFDDFVKDPGETYRRVLDFLELEDDGRREIRHKQGNKSYRFDWLQKTIYRPPEKVATAALNMERKARGKKSFVKRLTKRLKRFNVVQTPRRPLDEKMRRELAEAFRGEIDKLSDLFGRDFSHWMP
jgi:hypothetical protein